MDIEVLDTNLELVYVIDTFKSFLWVERYNECGDFEIYTNVDYDILNNVQKDYFLRLNDSETLMIVESITITSHSEQENKLLITGRSLESILTRRIIWGQKILRYAEQADTENNVKAGGLEEGIKTLIDCCIINPQKPVRDSLGNITSYVGFPERKISNFRFQYSDNPDIRKIKLKAQYIGDCLYDIISTLCSEHNLGFKVIYDFNINAYVFYLYQGEDKSDVVFSPEYDNLTDINYTESVKDYKNAILVGGEGENSSEVDMDDEREYVEIGMTSGLERREVFYDASSITHDIEDPNDFDGETKSLDDAEYIEHLTQKGNEQLEKYKNTKAIEGEIVNNVMYQYGVDYKIGDIVYTDDGYGHKNKTRVVEFIHCQDEQGYRTYPTFKIDEDDNTI